MTRIDWSSPVNPLVRAAKVRAASVTSYTRPAEIDTLKSTADHRAIIGFTPTDRMADPTDPPVRVQAGADRGIDILLFIVVLASAAAARLRRLASPGYSVDELWTADLGVGRGSMHLHLPLNAMVSPPPPDLFRINDAPPWWHVWTHMECTHPPLY